MNRGIIKAREITDYFVDKDEVRSRPPEFAAFRDWRCGLYHVPGCRCSGLKRIVREE